MRGSILRRALVLMAVFLMLNTSVVSAQVSGGMKGQPATEEAATSSGSGPCWPDRGTDPVTDPEEAGLVGRRAYESPQFGYTVDWTRDWVLDEYFETPVISFPEEERDALCLWLDDSSLYAYLYVIGQTASRGGPDADLEEWTDPDYIAGNWDADVVDVEVVIGDATRKSAQVTYRLVDLSDDSEYYSTFVSIEQKDGSMIYLTFFASAASFEDAYQMVSEDITLDGKGMFNVLDWDEIEAEL